jgi:trehalose-6-phosphate hydrolase
MLLKYKKLIALRNTEPALQFGSYDELYFSNDCIHFTRNFQGAKVCVIINFGEPFTLNLPGHAKVLLGNPVLETDGFIIFKSL